MIKTFITKDDWRAVADTIRPYLDEVPVQKTESWQRGAGPNTWLDREIWKAWDRNHPVPASVKDLAAAFHLSPRRIRQRLHRFARRAHYYRIVPHEEA